MRVRRSRRFVFLASIVLLLFAGGWLLVPQEKLLLKRAAFETSAQGWTVDRGPDACITYGWLSDRDVFFCQGGFLSDSPLCRRNVRTGVQSGLKLLSRLFRKTHGDPDGVTVSPDGKWALWDGGGSSVVCAAIDGSSYRQYLSPKRGYRAGYWLNGSNSQWVEFVREHIDGGPDSVRLHKAELCDAGQPLPASSSPARLMPRDTAVLLPDGPALIVADAADSTHGAQPVSTARITETNLLLSNRPAQSRQIPAPHDCRIDALVISPDAHWLAWLVHFNAIDPVSALINRLNPRYPASIRNTVGLWVSRLDGSDLREIGHIEITRDYPEVPDGSTLKWMPDGKRLSFVYKDGLYSVPTQ